MKTLENFEYEMNNCFRCSHCKYVPWAMLQSQRFSQICPSITKFNFHAYSGSGKIQMALSLHQGRNEGWTDEMLKVIYTCTNCGACAVSCSTNNYLTDVFGILMALKQKAVEDGAGPLPAHKKYTEYIGNQNNPYNEPHNERFKWLPDDVEVKEKADVVFWAGCTSSYRRMEIAQATVRLLNIMGIDFMILGEDEICCGSPIYQTGQYDKAKTQAKNVLDKLKKSGAKTILTSCSGCFAMFKTKYPMFFEEASSWEVLSLAEVLDKKIKSGELKFTKEIPMKVTYHDPCHLGRLGEVFPDWNGEWKLTGPHILEPIPERPQRMGLGGVYEPPRDILKAIPGIELIEMERIKEYSWCCGAGAGCKAAFPDFALWAGSERVEEAKSTEADALSSSCPLCKSNLTDAITANNESIKFYDISELALMALGENKGGDS